MRTPTSRALGAAYMVASARDGSLVEEERK
jgi:hypothetical protein